MPSRISSGISNNRTNNYNNYGNQFRPKQNLPSLKNNYGKNNIKNGKNFNRNNNIVKVYNEYILSLINKPCVDGKNIKIIKRLFNECDYFIGNNINSYLLKQNNYVCFLNQSGHAKQAMKILSKLQKIDILNYLNKGIGTFIKIQDSMYLRNKSIINIGDVYLVIIFCDKGENINNINKNDIYGFNCDLKIKVYNNNEKEYYYEKEKEKDIKIGRVNYANDIELNDSLASKVNCVIRYNNIKGWIIKDGSDSILKNGEIMRNFSKNGTWISVNDNIQITDKMIFKSNFNIFKCDFLQV